MQEDHPDNVKGLRIIKTARNQREINQAVKQGFRALVKPVIPSDKIYSIVRVYQHVKTGEVTTRQYSKSNPFINFDVDYKVVIPSIKYYPYPFESPFAAYLIPTDLQRDERVFIEDIIEDYPQESWDKTSFFRPFNCEAIWDGNDFIMLFDEEEDRGHCVG